MNKDFMLAGHAIFTVTNLNTGKSFTYRITTAPGKPHFVSVLTGPDNTSDYTFIGTIFEQQTFRHSLKSGVGKDAQSVRSFEWLWNHIDQLPSNVKLSHCGYCARCGKTLTTPESIEAGMGPTCSKIVEKVKVMA